GVAGRLGASGITVAGVPTGVDMTAGTWSLVVSTRTTGFIGTIAFGNKTVAVDLPPGPFARREATDVALTAGGLTIAADVVVERRTDLLAIGVTNASLLFEASGSVLLVGVTDASGLFVVSGAAV